MARPPYAKTGHCVHLTELVDRTLMPIRTCRAGVDYRDLVGGVSPNWVRRLPCRPHSGSRTEEVSECTQRRLPTAEAVEGWEAWRTTRMNNTLLALRRVADLEGQRGVVSCPACSGTLRWTRAGPQKHVHAKCDTPECLAFMQ